MSMEVLEISDEIVSIELDVPEPLEQTLVETEIKSKDTPYCVILVTSIILTIITMIIAIVIVCLNSPKPRKFILF
ncbi:hypothetical protein I4U23_003973 [Adineta vaga]|nr:hypothetical protein I4U23_003973 [Adineta vaga]